MYYATKEISKEMYNLATHNRGRIPADKKIEVFGEALCCGYGVYLTEVYRDGDRYMVKYDFGSSCD